MRVGVLRITKNQFHEDRTISESADRAAGCPRTDTYSDRCDLRTPRVIKVVDQDRRLGVTVEPVE